MIQNVIRAMGGISGFGIISVCLFFLVFTGVLLWAFAQRKSFCERMSTLPLEDGSVSETKGGTHE